MVAPRSAYQPFEIVADAGAEGTRLDRWLVDEFCARLEFRLPEERSDPLWVMNRLMLKAESANVVTLGDIAGEIALNRLRHGPSLLWP